MDIKELKAHRASLVEKKEALIRQVHVLDGAVQEANFWIEKIEKEEAAVEPSKEAQKE